MSGRGSLLLAAARRFAVLLFVIAAPTAVVSLVLGLLAGAAWWRAVSVGFYCVGCFFIVSGFFLGARGPVRLRGDGGQTVVGTGLRWLAPGEREAALSDSAIFVALGFALLALGVLTDQRYPIF